MSTPGVFIILQRSQYESDLFFISESIYSGLYFRISRSGIPGLRIAVAVNEARSIKSRAMPVSARLRLLLIMIAKMITLENPRIMREQQQNNGPT